MEHKNNNIPTEERRSFTLPINFEERAEGNDLGTCSGYAALFGSRSENLGWFTEIIEPGAFAETDFSDVVALFNHDINRLLARSSGGTGSLALQVDEKGLKYSFSIPDTTTGRDLAVYLQRGDVKGSSFSFRVAYKGEEWEEDKDGNLTRHISKIAIVRDVSPVVFPAYTATDVAKRSWEQYAKPGEKQRERDQLMIEAFRMKAKHS